MKKLNIYELHGEMNRRKETRTRSMDNVLERCHNKIRSASKKELSRIYFEVPEFVIGLPVYKLNDCILHIMKSLNQNGFVVKYFFPKLLYISWDFDEINDMHNKLLEQDTTHHYNKTNPVKEIDSIREMDKMLLTSKAIQSNKLSIASESTNKQRDNSSKKNKKIPYIAEVNNKGKFVLNLD